MGFRYAKVETDIDLTEARVYRPRRLFGNAGHRQLSCGNADVNQLVQKRVWSQKATSAISPTDCPTRERAGWTGDMGVFIETGLTLMDCYPVVEKWLAECRLNQYRMDAWQTLRRPPAAPAT